MANHDPNLGGRPVAEPGRGAISVQDVTMTYGSGKKQVHALATTNVEVPAGDFLSILGPSGCGKTTLLKIMGDILPPSTGQVLIDGKPVEAMRRTGQIGYVFQQPVLLPWRTIRENVQLPFDLNKSSRTKAEIRDEIDKVLAVVGLSDFAERLPGELSGGMQSRVAIARALVYKPRVLLMDEPFASLDELTRTEMCFHLLEIWQTIRTTVIFITHHIHEAVLLSSKVLLLSERPGAITRKVDVDLPRPRSMETRTLPEFQEISEDLVAEFHRRSVKWGA